VAVVEQAVELAHILIHNLKMDRLAQTGEMVEEDHQLVLELKDLQEPLAEEAEREE
jgi:regulator of replication initiation timing